jgi:anti-anti-sigma regulatory factor
MALKITDQNGIFILEGSINSATSELLQNHLNIIMEKNKKVTVNIDLVNHIDINGILVLKGFYQNTLKDKRDFSIIGYTSEEIFKGDNFENAA